MTVGISSSLTLHSILQETEMRPFEADAHIPAINLADPQLKLNVQSSRNSDFQLLAPQGKNLLLGFCGVQGFFRREFDPVKQIAFTKGVALTTAGPDDLFFGQVP
jgi:hypothetical protein